MSTTVFNNQFDKLISDQKHPIFDYIKFKYRESNRNNYFGFFDDFLFDYGVLTLTGFSPSLKTKKFIPYINCSDKNIFNEKKGITNLSDEELSMNDCQKLTANYLFSKLKNTSIENFENWKME